MTSRAHLGAAAGPGGLLEFVKNRLNENGHCVIVVAEGAGQDYVKVSNQRFAVRGGVWGHLGSHPPMHPQSCIRFLDPLRTGICKGVADPVANVFLIQ